MVPLDFRNIETRLNYTNDSGMVASDGESVLVRLLAAGEDASRQAKLKSRWAGRAVLVTDELITAGPVEVRTGDSVLLGEAVSCSRTSLGYAVVVVVEHSLEAGPVWLCPPERTKCASDPAPGASRSPQDTAETRRRWLEDLRELPTIFGRMERLARALDKVTGRYADDGLAAALGLAATSDFLRSVHQQAYADWLLLTIQQQKADLDAYIGSQPGHRTEIVARWTNTDPQCDLVPPGTPEYDRELFLAELRAIMQVVANAHTRSAAHPRCSPEPAEA